MDAQCKVLPEDRRCGDVKETMTGFRVQSNWAKIYMVRYGWNSYSLPTLDHVLSLSLPSVCMNCGTFEEQGNHCCDQSEQLQRKY